MNFEYILEIPFESRGEFYKKSNSKYKYKGNAYYLLNKDGQVLRDFVQLDSELVEIRPNDNDMMIGSSGTGTTYWKQSIVQNIRKNNFPSSAINKQVVSASEDLIKKMNDYALENHGTSLMMEGLLSGSNTSGADARISATPFIAVDDEFYGFRFVNAFKNIRIDPRNRNSYINHPITKSQLESSVKLTMKDYFDKFKHNRKIFYKYNPESYNVIFHDTDEMETQRLYFLEKSISLTKEAKSYNETVAAILDKYNNSEIIRDVVIQRLRGILRALLLIEKHLIKDDVVIGRNESDSNLDAAHLYDVRWIKKEDDSNLYKIADVNNGLLLPKEIHWRFDKDSKYFINDDFEIIDDGKKVGEINKLFINDERMKYLNNRNNKLKH